jgi:NAD(P)-dependent dehydrogenase (short-subunit alcohol dehydrogenase family)
MKILYLTTLPPSQGGAQASAKPHALAMRRLGHAVAVVCQRLFEVSVADGLPPRRYRGRPAQHQDLVDALACGTPVIASAVGSVQELVRDGNNRRLTPPGDLAAVIAALTAEAELLRLIPYGRIGEPADVALAAVWLCSDAADYVTGTTLYVDGGMGLFPDFRYGG